MRNCSFTGSGKPSAEAGPATQWMELERCKEDCRDMRRLNVIENLAKDLDYAGRTLRRSSVLTVAGGDHGGAGKPAVNYTVLREAARPPQTTPTACENTSRGSESNGPKSRATNSASPTLLTDTTFRLSSPILDALKVLSATIRAPKRVCEVRNIWVFSPL
jgi:hypothetical protein